MTEWEKSGVPVRVPLPGPGLEVHPLHVLLLCHLSMRKRRGPPDVCVRVGELQASQGFQGPVVADGAEGFGGGHPDDFVGVTEESGEPVDVPRPPQVVDILLSHPDLSCLAGCGVVDLSGWR